MTRESRRARVLNGNELTNIHQIVYTKKRKSGVYMKKLLSYVLILVFLLSFSGISETELTHYTHPDYGCSFSYPADWVVLDTETIQSLFEQSRLKEILKTDDVSVYQQQIATNKMAMFVNYNNDNFNIVATPMRIPLPAQSVIDYILPDLINQFSSVYNGIRFINKGDILEIGGKEYAYIQYTLQEETVSTQYYCCENGKIYTLTFTSFYVDDALSYLESEQLFKNVLRTFEP